MITKGDEHRHYADLTRKAAYFALSWYYVWDVPFAQGQMLGDIGLKTRGWGNVSVENNHIDVFVFEFASVLQWLSMKGIYVELPNPVFIRKSFNIPTGIMAKMGKGIITISSHRDGQSLLCGSY